MLTSLNEKIETLEAKYEAAIPHEATQTLATKAAMHDATEKEISTKGCSVSKEIVKNTKGDWITNCKHIASISPLGAPQIYPNELTIDTQQIIDQIPAPRKRRSQAEIIAHQTSIYDDIQQRRRTNALPNPPKSREPTPPSKPTASALPGLLAKAKSHPDLPQPDGQEAPNVVPPENDDPGKDLAPNDENESFTSKIISATESITISDNSEPSAAPCSTPPPSPNPRPSPARTCIKRAFNVGTYLRLLLLPLAACTRSNRPRNEGHLPGHDV